MNSRRKKTPNANEIEVLAKSGRRCCICFYVNGDTHVKKGQIAHLDHNPANFKLENLAWLCLKHHDEYDTKPSQSKGWKIGEVQKYRDQLHKTVAQMQIASTSKLSSLPHTTDSVSRSKRQKSSSSSRARNQRSKKKSIQEFIDQVVSIQQEARSASNVAIAQERFRRLSEEIKTYLAKNISKAESDAFSVIVDPPWGGDVYRGDPVGTFYKSKITPALSYLQVLADSLNREAA